ncbi:MAG: DEAD/DEAH box helicase, partial [Rhabdochlamydiaceae bacterium]
MPESEQLERLFSDLKREVESYGLVYEELPEAVKRILSNREYFVVKYKLFEQSDGTYGKSVDEIGLDSSLASSLKAFGTSKMYAFQEQAVDSILEGKNTVVVAPTGNGKTVAFAVPIFQKILTEKEQPESEDNRSDRISKTRALFIYPTKALARDQLGMLERLTSTLDREVSIAVFDGDTPSYERQKILAKPPDIIISNFDTVEYHLRNNTHFAELLRNLSFVVVDELHTYVGAFGTHVHFILRRLRRTLREPEKLQLIGSSATVRNPKQFAEQLFNCSIIEIKCENGRRGRIHFVMLYPTKTSMTSMMAGCVRFLLSSGMKTLVFANTHKNAEVLNLALRHSGIHSDIH